MKRVIRFIHITILYNEYFLTTPIYRGLIMNTDFNQLTAGSGGIEHAYAKRGAKELHASVESIDAILTGLSGEVTTEGLLNVLDALGDNVLKIAKSFKALVMPGMRTSELREWFESNTLVVKRLEGMGFDRVASVDISIPQGMSKSYLETTTKTLDAYSAIDVPARVSAAVSIVDNMLSSMSKGMNAHETIVHNNAKMVIQDVKAAMPVLKQMTSCYSSKRTGEVPADKMFTSMTELKDTRMMLLANEGKLQAVQAIQANLDDMSESLELAVAFISEAIKLDDPTAYVPSKAFVRDFADYVKHIGIAVENYSNITFKHMALEHNLVLTYIAMLG